MLSVSLPYAIMVSMRSSETRRLYITHYPLIHLQVQWTVNHPNVPAATHVFVAVCVFVASILLAYATYKLYDLPVREWLKQKLFRQTEKS